ncbi:AsnC family protein [Kibdelosporangium philippinense]|uniref:AsnC family protein n=1 Tax=Kibdelosporangium philippinense TaxID=211113 RepID=UPI003623497A
MINDKRASRPFGREGYGGARAGHHDGVAFPAVVTPDPVDMRLLSLIAEMGRAAVHEVAARLGMDPREVASRLVALSANGLPLVVGVECDPNGIRAALAAMTPPSYPVQGTPSGAYPAAAYPPNVVQSGGYPPPTGYLWLPPGARQRELRRSTRTRSQQERPQVRTHPRSLRPRPARTRSTARHQAATRAPHSHQASRSRPSHHRHHQQTR